MTNAEIGDWDTDRSWFKDFVAALLRRAEAGEQPWAANVAEIRRWTTTLASWELEDERRAVEDRSRRQAMEAIQEEAHTWLAEFRRRQEQVEQAQKRLAARDELHKELESLLDRAERELLPLARGYPLRDLAMSSRYLPYDVIARLRRLDELHVETTCAACAAARRRLYSLPGGPYG